MSKKKPVKKVVVKPPRVSPRQPKLKNRKSRKPRVNGPMTESSPALELGPRLMPTSDLALEVLEEVATMNDAALRLEEVYKQKAKDAKDAKDAWKAKVEEMQRHVRLNTHESSLPLLTEAEREADLQQMADTIKAEGEL